jgi:hypothetical protein
MSRITDFIFGAVTVVAIRDIFSEGRPRDAAFDDNDLPVRNPAHTPRTDDSELSTPSHLSVTQQPEGEEGFGAPSLQDKQGLSPAQDEASMRLNPRS